MNETFWAIRRREKANRDKAKAAKAKKVEEVVEEVVEEPSYRDLQAQAKELDIPANQTADDLKAAIEDASGEDAEE
jgi:phenylacetate-coenzyme A ligase PaaK-like adenylate-forming protein